MQNSGFQNPPPSAENDVNGTQIAPMPFDENDTERPRRPEHMREPTPMMLVNEVSKIFHNILRETGEQYNIQNSFRAILFHLSIKDGVTQLHLSQVTHLKPPTISVTLQKMENEGYVTRVADQYDMRQTHVYITEKGAQYNNKIREIIKSIEEKITGDFSQEELQLLTELLKKMRSSMIEGNRNKSGNETN